MKKLTFTLLALLFTVAATAQVDDDMKKEAKNAKEKAMDEFDRFVQQANDEFEDFRQKANAEYAKFMEEAWTLYKVKDAEEPPMQPKPVTITFEHEAVVTNSKIEYDEIEVSPSERLPKTRLPLGSISPLCSHCHSMVRQSRCVSSQSRKTPSNSRMFRRRVWPECGRNCHALITTILLPNA